MILGTIKKVIKTVFKAVYSVISFFNLQYALLVLLIGLVLFITGVFEENNSLYIIFWVVLGLSLLLALVLNYRKVFPKKKKKQKRGKGAIPEGQQMVDGQVPGQIPAPVPGQVPGYAQYPDPRVYRPIEEKPLKYFRVRQNPNYIVAEYADRYELYVKTSNGLKRVRADYK